jgi:hypothetical protein
MPHRVADLLPNLVHIKPKNHSNNPSRRSSTSEEGHETGGGGLGRMPDHLADALKAPRRLSFPFNIGKKDHSGNGASDNGAARLDWQLESPAIIFHGSGEDSTGAMLSGQVKLEVRDDRLRVASLAASLRIRATHKKAFQHHCPECQTQYTDVKSWQLLAAPKTLTRGTHLFPFSTLLDGHLPASANGSSLTIDYEFRADAKLAPTPNPGTHQHQHQHAPPVLRFVRTIPVKRALPIAEHPHHSVRLFPPTNIKTSAHYASVIHPGAKNTVTLKLDGLMSLNERTKTLDLWKLKRVSWKLEEIARTVAPACDKHKFMVVTKPHAEGESPDEERRGVTRSESRVLGEKHLHEGWKSDYTGTDGTVDMEFDYSISSKRTGAGTGAGGKGQPKYACDDKSQAMGLSITHSLLIEMVVSKEYAPVGKPHMSAQTGTGRILRMHYGVVLTENPGCGVSWDEETPPLYQDVPASPPGYPLLEGPIDYEELELLDTGAGYFPVTGASGYSSSSSVSSRSDR